MHQSSNQQNVLAAYVPFLAEEDFDDPGPIIPVSGLNKLANHAYFNVINPFSKIPSAWKVFPR
jgi:hypothetical protein